MLTGAASDVGPGFRSEIHRRLGLAVAGVAVGLAVASCHSSRSGAPLTADAAAAPAELPAAAAPPPPRGKQITIAYSSNILGEYEPCG
jgi:hypothetical protein